MTRSTRW